jgi:predicted nucleic acid-binding protein
MRFGCCDTCDCIGRLNLCIEDLSLLNEIAFILGACSCKTDDINLTEALEISIRNSIYEYDAYYMYAAKRHRIELLSLDNKMLEVAKVEGVKIKEIK